MELYDAVELAVDLPDEGLKAGTVGTIVEVYRNPDLAYEVEFSDSEGRTVAMLALGAQQLTISCPRREMTESQRLWEAWWGAYVRVATPTTVAQVVCPSCGDGVVRVVYTGDPDTRLGYATAWCDTCHVGIALCRMSVPADVPMLPFGMDPAGRAKVIPPDVMLLPPDPWLDDDVKEEF